MRADIGVCLLPPADRRRSINQHCNALGVPLRPPHQPIQLAPQTPNAAPRSGSLLRLCPFSADPAETSDTPHNGRCNTPLHPPAGHTIVGKYPRCGRPLPNPPSGYRPFPLRRRRPEPPALPPFPPPYSAISPQLIASHRPLCARSNPATCLDRGRSPTSPLRSCSPSLARPIPKSHKIPPK